MDYRALHNAATEHGEGFVEWANETLYTLRPGSLCGYGTVSLHFGDAVADGIANFLQANAPHKYALFVAGNVDWGTEAVQAMADSLGPLAGVPQAVIDGLKDLGRTSRKRCADWGFVEVTQADVDAAAAWVAAEDKREANDAAWHSLVNEILWPNIADVTTPPTAAEFRTLLGL